MSSLSRLTICIAGVGLLACGDDKKSAVLRDAAVEDASRPRDAALAEDATTPWKPDDAGPSQGPNGKACDDASRLGGFRVEIEKTYTTVDGSVQSKVVTSIKSELVAEENGCRLVKRSYPFCDPLCAAGKACTVDATCVSEPKSLNAGTATITGLLGPVAMEPVQPGNRYFDTSLPTVGFEADAKIRLRTSGDELEALDMSAVGVAPLALLDSKFVVARDKPLVVQWKKTARGKGKIRVTVNVDQHGSSPITLECATDDVGSHEIPAKLMTALLDAGVSGFPTGHVFRESVDSREVEGGCVDFLVGSHLLAAIEVEGHTPCNRPADCKPSETCQIATNTCIPN